MQKILVGLCVKNLTFSIFKFIEAKFLHNFFDTT